MKKLQLVSVQENSRADFFVSSQNHDYQHQIADNLIQTMGLQEAVGFAVENGWDGVLSQIKIPLN